MSSDQKKLELITAESVQNMYRPKSDVKPKLTKEDSSFYNIFDINMRNKNEINKNEINKNNHTNYKYNIIILILLISLIIFIVLYILENKKYNECQLKI